MITHPPTRSILRRLGQPWVVPLCTPYTRHLFARVLPSQLPEHVFNQRDGACSTVTAHPATDWPTCHWPTVLSFHPARLTAIHTHGT